MQNVLAAINQNDYLKVSEYLVTDNEREDIFRIKTRVCRVYYFLTKFHHNKYNSLNFFSDYKLDVLARIKFAIPLFIGFDPLTGVKSATLNLYFGSPQIIIFNKLSGFELEKEVDVEYRGKLLYV